MCSFENPRQRANLTQQAVSIGSEAPTKTSVLIPNGNVIYWCALRDNDTSGGEAKPNHVHRMSPFIALHTQQNWYYAASDVYHQNTAICPHTQQSLGGNLEEIIPRHSVFAESQFPVACWVVEVIASLAEWRKSASPGLNGITERNTFVKVMARTHIFIYPCMYFSIYVFRN